MGSLLSGTALATAEAAPLMRMRKVAKVFIQGDQIRRESVEVRFGLTFQLPQPPANNLFESFSTSTIMSLHIGTEIGALYLPGCYVISQ